MCIQLNNSQTILFIVIRGIVYARITSQTCKEKWDRQLQIPVWVCNKNIWFFGLIKIFAATAPRFVI